MKIVCKINHKTKPLLSTSFVCHLLHQCFRYIATYFKKNSLQLLECYPFRNLTEPKLRLTLLPTFHMRKVELISLPTKRLMRCTSTLQVHRELSTRCVPIHYLVHINGLRESSTTIWLRRSLTKKWLSATFVNSGHASFYVVAFGYPFIRQI